DIVGDEPRTRETLGLLLYHREVRHGRDRDDSLVETRLGDPRLEGGVSAIGPAEDGKLRRIGYPLAHEPFCASRHIADRRPPATKTVLGHPGVSVARGAPVIGLQYRIALTDEE